MEAQAFEWTQQIQPWVPENTASEKKALAPHNREQQVPSLIRRRIELVERKGTG